MANSTNRNSGVGFTGLLAIAFIVLKLIGKIDWSWWWVLSPLWIFASVIVAILIIIGVVYLFISIFTKKGHF